MHYLLECSGQAWVDKLRVEAFRRILDQPKSWFELDDNTVSRLNGCLDRNAEEMRNLVGRFAGFVFVAASMTTIATIWSFIICWKLTIVALASAPAMYLIMRAFEYVSGQWESRSNDAAEVAEAIFTETFSSIRTVRALTLEGYFRTKHGSAAGRVLAVGLKRSAYSGLFYGVSESGILFITGMFT
jgi:ATP-binding cassette subfamily B (MDR/TAP) protein 1